MAQTAQAEKKTIAQAISDFLKRETQFDQEPVKRLTEVVKILAKAADDQQSTIDAQAERIDQLERRLDEISDSVSHLHQKIAGEAVTDR